MEFLCRITTIRNISLLRLFLANLFILLAAVCTAAPQTSQLQETPINPALMYRSALVKERLLRTPGTVHGTDAERFTLMMLFPPTSSLLFLQPAEAKSRSGN